MSITKRIDNANPTIYLECGNLSYFKPIMRMTQKPEDLDDQKPHNTLTKHDVLYREGITL